MRDRNRLPSNISDFDFENLRTAFKSLTANGRVSEGQWDQLAKDLIQDLTDHNEADEELVCRIIGR